tara:strand:- start:51 stop:353 length:303 start_codon:yes stop_codon:yes gene_type:complete
VSFSLFARVPHVLLRYHWLKITIKTQIHELEVGGSIMKANSVEEELEHLAKLVEEAEALGMDPWPEEKQHRPWAKFALASFMIIMMISWVSKWMYRFADV